LIRRFFGPFWGRGDGKAILIETHFDQCKMRLTAKLHNSPVRVPRLNGVPEGLLDTGEKKKDSRTFFVGTTTYAISTLAIIE